MRPPAAAQRPGHRATTANAQAIYPFVAEGGLGGRGVLHRPRPLRRLVHLRPVRALRAARHSATRTCSSSARSARRKSSLVKTLPATARRCSAASRGSRPEGRVRPARPRARRRADPARARAATVRLNPIGARDGLGGAAQPAAGARRQRARPAARARGGGGAARGASRAQRRASPSRRCPRVVELLLRPTDDDGRAARDDAGTSSPMARPRRRARAAAALRGRPARDVRRADDARAASSTAAPSCSTCRRSTTRGARRS